MNLHTRTSNVADLSPSLEGKTIQDHSPYSPTILKNVLSLVLDIFQYLKTFECNTTSNWLN